ncbi:acyl-CoA dehydrogenase family member 11 isoform X2 [Lampetra planeri]
MTPDPCRGRRLRYSTRGLWTADEIERARESERARGIHFRDAEGKSSVHAEMADSTEVRIALDVRALQEFLQRNLPARPGPWGPLSVRQYSAGQSNPTYYLRTAAGQELVLRKSPPGALLPGAHQVDREFRVQQALSSVGFPVPRPLLYCQDKSIIGTPFYVMEHVEGRIFRDPALPGHSPAERAALYVAMIETLARLHSLDWEGLGLGGFGKKGGYCKRQVLTWTKQYNAAAHTDIDSMNKLSDWLQKNLPGDDSEAKLVHGDFRIDNLIYHPTEARVIAVLDWELATIGHPLADLAYNFLPYHQLPTGAMTSVLGSVPIPTVPGVPTEAELLSVYCRCRETPSAPLPHWNFFMALALFKIASIAQGVYARHLLGNASAENASQFCGAVQPLAETALALATAVPAKVEGKFSSPELFRPSPVGQLMLDKVRAFLREYIYPAEPEVLQYYQQHASSPLRWKRPPIIQQLKDRAKAAGLWNLFLPAVSGLGQLDYAFVAEETGRCVFAPEIFNCQAPDTGNMEVLHLYGTEQQKRDWLEPLLRGEIHSCFCMTEPDVASSDATNIMCSIRRDGNHYVVNGRKWWSSGAGNPNCTLAVVMGRTGDDSLARHKQHSMILVAMDTPGVKIIRPLMVFGYDDAIHGGHFEIHFENVRVPASNILLGDGRGFEIAQGRLGPGRIHHCMRTVGLAERALELLCQRAATRQAFGRKLYEHEVVLHQVAECRLEIEQSRLLTLKAAHAIDAVGAARARKEISMIKVAAPRMACKVLDRAIQVHGGAGVSEDFPLAHMLALARTLRLADGPDEVHLSAIGKQELGEQLKARL